MSTAAWVWVASGAVAVFLLIVFAACVLAQIDAALKASRPISHEVDGCRCGGGRHG